MIHLGKLPDKQLLQKLPVWQYGKGRYACFFALNIPFPLGIIEANGGNDEYEYSIRFSVRPLALEHLTRNASSVRYGRDFSICGGNHQRKCSGTEYFTTVPTSHLMRLTWENPIIAVTLAGDFTVPSWNQEWLEFIKENRTKGGIQHAYDVVVGPVADDNTMETVQLYLSGILKAEEAVERLR